ncbi:MAG: hypothetical protein J0M12_10485 [Deltaproteobacteria bacterium]|nr:hypothetical protein [Deltaproteobacteria bacterium]
MKGFHALVAGLVALLVLGIVVRVMSLQKFNNFQSSAQAWLDLDRSVYDCSDDDGIAKPADPYEMLKAVGPRITMARTLAAIAATDLAELKQQMASSSNPDQVRTDFLLKPSNRRFHSTIDRRLNVPQLEALRDATLAYNTKGNPIHDALALLPGYIDGIVADMRTTATLRSEIFPQGIPSDGLSGLRLPPPQ